MYLRSRPIRVFVRLNESEYKKFLSLVEKSGLSKSAYLRHLINGLQPRDHPPQKYYEVMDVLYSISDEINSLCADENIEAQKTALKIDRVIKNMTDLSISPEKLRSK